jgi:hypothetical protein
VCDEQGPSGAFIGVDREGNDGASEKYTLDPMADREARRHPSHGLFPWPVPSSIISCAYRNSPRTSRASCGSWSRRRSSAASLTAHAKVRVEVVPGPAASEPNELVQLGLRFDVATRNGVNESHMDQL